MISFFVEDIMQENFTLKNGKTVLIRDIVPDDYLAMQTYLQQLATETIFTNQYVGRKPRSKESFDKQCDNPCLWGVGVFDGDKIVGACQCFIYHPEHLWCGYTAQFGIHMLEEVQSSGLGTHLMNLMERWCLAQGMERIEASVRTQNRKAISLYLKCGYEIEGLSKRKALIDGVWHDEYRIAKLLNNVKG